MIQDCIEETYGFKVHTAYIAEVKRDLGLLMYDAPNLVGEFKKNDNWYARPKVRQTFGRAYQFWVGLFSVDFDNAFLYVSLGETLYFFL